ncbi:MAG: hypothetical protein AABY73_02070 [Pseudomonadota bacterium]
MPSSFPSCAIVAIGISPPAYFPLKRVRFFGGFFTLVFCLSASAQELRLSIDDMVAPSFSLRGISAQLTLSAPSKLDITIAQATLQGREWRKLALHCPDARVERDLIECRRGTLDVGEKIPLTFQYRPGARSFALTLFPGSAERWQAQLIWRGGNLAASWEVKNGKAVRLNPWLPEQSVRFSQGVLDLTGKLEIGDKGKLDVSAILRNGAFSDAAGTRAGEKLAGTLTLQGVRAGAWRWNMAAAWREGEVFWQPFYFAPGERRLSAQGSWGEAQAVIDQAQLEWTGIGTAQLSGAWNRAAGRIEHLQVTAKSMALDPLYRTFVKPWAQDGVLSKLALSGVGDGAASIKQGVLDEATLVIRQGGLKHEEKLFGLAGIDASLAWQQNQARENRINVMSGEVGKLPLGAFSVRATLALDRISMAPLRLPILDGALTMEGVEAQRENNDWRWTLSAALQPISMQRLSQALQLPAMHGTLSAVIPQVHYERQSLTVGGALLFKVFDGAVVVKDLRATDLLSPTPHVYANIDMRNLDLDLLTRTFSFGNMQGRLDVSVNALELFGWRPVKFDAKVASSAGDYPRKISQRAVENISSLGGAGGAAALQRSFLRFFDQFGYERIGLSCRLERGVCEMAGIEDVPQGYLIVKGGGIPALSVIGYNRRVGWDELLARIQRATQGGKPIVQ